MRKGSRDDLEHPFMVALEDKLVKSSLLLLRLAEGSRKEFFTVHEVKELQCLEVEFQELLSNHFATKDRVSKEHTLAHLFQFMLEQGPIDDLQAQERLKPKSQIPSTSIYVGIFLYHLYIISFHWDTHHWQVEQAFEGNLSEL